MLPIATKPTDQYCSISIFKVPKYLQPVFFFIFELPLKLRVVYIRNNKRTEWQTWNLTNMTNCFCRYVISSSGETAEKVLLLIIWNPLLIEINFSQIRTMIIKHEKVCAVCPYLLFYCVFYTIKVERIQNSNSIGLLVFEILIF